MQHAYRPDIDGLRAVAVGAVVVFHAFPDLLGGGFIGVDVFFVISGYLITGLIVQARQAGTFRFAEFYARRARRLLPALSLVLLAALGAGSLTLLTSELVQLCRHVLAGIAFGSNVLLWREVNYFDDVAAHKPLLHLWSLAIEEQFYLLWPAALLLVWKRRLVAIGAALAASLALSLALSSETGAAAFYLPATRFWELLAGAALVHLPALPRRHRNIASIAGALLIAGAAALLVQGMPYPGWRAALPVAGAALVIAAGPGAGCNRLLASAPMVWLGRISYPLYLWHWPLLSFALIANFYHPLDWPLRAAIVLASVLLAWATWAWIEVPVRGRRWGRTWHVGVGFASVGILAALLAASASRLQTQPGEARALIAAYADFARSQRDAYPSRCDHYDWKTNSVRTAIDASCTAVRPGSFLLWGDSHAQSLWHGMRARLDPEIELALVATSGCRPSLHPVESSHPQACRAGNAQALSFITAQRPARVFVAQADGHEHTDWLELSRFVRAHGGELVLIGPTPQWRPSLPAVVAKDLHARSATIGLGLDRTILQTDAAVRSRYAGTELRYVSLVGALCSGAKCLARVDGATPPLDLLVMDYGHLMPAGSDLVAQQVLAEVLRR